MPVPRIGCLVFAATIFLALTGATQSATNIGITSAVLPQAKGTPPTAAPRVLQVGTDMVANERVETGENGKVHLLFIDGTALTVGPNSDLTLDEFVYDPDTKTGKIALSTTKGLFRLVGGKISKKTPVTLKTPTATIGIRGGISLTTVTAIATRAVLLFGDQMTVTAEGVTQSANRPGSMITVAVGAAPEAPVPVTDNVLAAGIAGLEGAAPEEQQQVRVGDEDVAQSQLATIGSAEAPPADAFTNLPPPDTRTLEDDADAIFALQEQLVTESAGIISDGDRTATSAPSATTTSASVVKNLSGLFKRATSTAVGANEPGDTKAFSGGTFTAGRFTASGAVSLDFPVVPDAGGNFSFDGAIDGVNSPFGALSGSGFISGNNDFIFIEASEDSNPGNKIIGLAGLPTADAVTSDGPFRFSIRRDSLLDTDIPFISKLGGGAFISPTVSDLFVFSPTGEAPLQDGFLQASIGFTGQGATQVSSFSLLLGQTRDDPGSVNAGFLQGQMRGSTLIGTTSRPNMFDGGVATADDALGNDVFGSTNADFFLLEAAEVDINDTAVNRGIKRTNSSGVASTFFPNNLASRVAPGSVGTVRNNVSFNGWVAGAVQRFDSAFVPISTCSGSHICTFRTATVNPANVLYQTNLTTNQAFASATVDLVTLGALANNTVRFGDTGGSTGQSAFIDDGLVGMIETAALTGLQINGTALADAHLYLVTDDLVPDTSLLPAGASFCVCAFMRWGYFGGELVTSGSNDKTLIHLANFVVGDIPTATEILGLSGSATYNGHAIGTVATGTPHNTMYHAAGDFTMTYSFASDTGSATISQWDNAHFGGGGATFTFNLTAVSGQEQRYDGFASASPAGFSATANIRGSFFRNGGDPAGGTGGHFEFFNSPLSYSAFGIFAGQK